MQGECGLSECKAKLKANLALTQHIQGSCPVADESN